MSDEEAREVEEWLTGASLGQEAGGGGERPAKASKLSQAKKNEMLFGAALAGDARALRHALDIGADPNAQERAYPYRTAMDAMLEAGAQAPCFLELLKAGGLCNRRNGTIDGARALAKQVKESAEKLIAARQEIAVQLAQWASVSLMLKASEQWAADGLFAPTPQEWFSRCALYSPQTVPKVWELARDHGCQAGAAEWARLSSFAGSAGPQNPDIREPYLKLLERQGRLMLADHAASLYERALQTDDVDMLKSLLKAGVRPGAAWMAQVQVAGERRWSVVKTSCPILVAAKAMGAAACFGALRGFKPAVRHAGEAYDLKALCLVGVTDALELHELGVRLEADSGENILHVWAAADQGQPRAGWATLAKKKPEFLNARNKAGKSPLEAQLAFLSGEEAQDFEKSLARVEARELAREMGPKSKKAKAPSSKPRL